MLESLLVAYSLLRWRTPVIPNLPAPLEVRQTTGGSLAVSVKRRAAIDVVPPGSQRVPMLSLALAATCDAGVPVYALSVRRRGLAENDDIAAVYVYADGARISRARPISAGDGTVTLPLRRFVVPACQTRLVDVLADFAADAAISGQHRLELSESPVQAQAASVTVLTAPAAAVRRIVPSGRQGRLTVEPLRQQGNLRVGENRVLATFRLSAEERNQYVTRLTLTNAGTARDEDIRDLRIEAGRDSVSDTVPSLRNDQAMFQFDPPLRIVRGGNRTITVRGTIAGSARRTLQLLIEEPSDVVTAR